MQNSQLNVTAVRAIRQDRMLALANALYRGAKVNFSSGGMRLIHIAVRYDNPLAVGLLIQHGANPNSKNAYGDTPLHMAAELDFSGPTFILLANGANAKTLSIIGDTPLHRAAGAGSYQALMAMLSRKVRPNMRNNLSRITPLHTAARYNQRDTAFALIKYGALINARDSDLDTPLIDASRAGSLDVVNLLLNFGASVDLRDAEGRTALMWAATKGDWPLVVKRLVAAGANVDLKNHHGTTALYCAKALGHKKTARILETL
jgi:ankyrin repeat protein